MTDQAIRVVPAGWYEDPASRAHVRWWNGLAWTEHTALKPAEQPRPQQQQTYQQQYGDGGYQQQGAGQQNAGQQYETTQPTVDQDAVTGAAAALAAQNTETAARIAEARALERQYGISTEEHDIIVRRASEGDGTPEHNTAGTAYDPNAYGTANWDDGNDEYEDEPRTGTASAWLIALWPILTLAALGAAAYYYFFVSSEPAVAGIPLVAGVALVPSLLTLLWAVSDAHKLRKLGNRPASPAFALLGPLVYLIARRTRVTGVGPLVTLIVLTLLAVGAPVAALQTGAAAPMLKAIEIQQAIRDDLVATGKLGSVSCDPFLSDFTLGSQFTCDATLPDGTPKQVWVSIDSRDGQFSYAIAIK